MSDLLGEILKNSFERRGDHPIGRHYDAVVEDDLVGPRPRFDSAVNLHLMEHLKILNDEMKKEHPMYGMFARQAKEKQKFSFPLVLSTKNPLRRWVQKIVMSIMDAGMGRYLAINGYAREELFDHLHTKVELLEKHLGVVPKHVQEDEWILVKAKKPRGKK